MLHENLKANRSRYAARGPLPQRLASRALSIASLSSALGCSLVVDAQREQCSTNVDCQQRGPAFADALCVENMCQADPVWACLGSVEEPLAQEAVEASLRTLSFIDGSGIPGIHARLYSAVDFALLTPLDAADTDSEGNATLSVPAGFAGFILLEAEGVIESSIVYATSPITTTEGFGAIYAGPPGASGNLVSLIGAVPQAGRGIALVSALGCDSGGGTGATLAFSGETQGSTPFYAFNGVASSSATKLDGTGQAGIVNVRPGVIGIETRWKEEAVSSASVLIRADTVTQVTLLPGRTGQGFGGVVGGQ